MDNRYLIQGDKVTIFIERKNGETLKTEVSLNKLERVKEVGGSWYAKLDTGTNQYYVIGTILENKKYRIVSLHRWVMGEPKGYDIDHNNHDTLDNTDDNLKISTRSDNLQNRRGANRNNLSSGVRGVGWHKRANKWYARIQVNNKTINLGYFSTVEQAEQELRNFKNKIQLDP